MLLHFLLHDLFLFVDPVHSFRYHHVILDGFTLGEPFFFIHIFSGATSHDYF